MSGLKNIALMKKELGQWDNSAGESTFQSSLATWAQVLQPTQRWEERTDFQKVPADLHTCMWHMTPPTCVSMCACVKNTVLSSWLFSKWKYFNM